MQKLPVVSKRIVTLDTHAILTFLYKETDGVIVKQYLEAADKKKTLLLLCEVNLGEVYYRTWKDNSRDYAEISLVSIRELPITLIPVDQQFILAAATWKAKYAISYADAFAVETALRNKCPILTGDPEFDVVKEIEIIRLGARKRKAT